MSWLTRLFRRKQASDALFDFPDSTDHGGRSWVTMPADEPSGAGGEADSEKLGFASSGAGFLRGTDRQSGTDRRYRHAFTPSQPVADVRRLAGRTALIRRVIRSIEDQDLHVVLFGDRGIGKTSVLKVIQGLAERANYLVHYVSCGQSATFSEVFRSLAKRIPLLYDGASDPTAGNKDGDSSLADYLPDGDFSVSQLTEVFSRIEGTRILLILDEFDRSDVNEFRRAIGELIKNLSDSSIRVQLLIGGVAANLSELVAHVPSIRRNIVGIGVPNLDRDEVAEMVDIAEASGNVRFDAMARDRLTEVSAGLPYLVGLIGQHAVLEASDSGEAWIGKAHVDRAVAVGCDEIASRLSLRCNFALDRIGAARTNLLERAAVEATSQGGLIVDPAITTELRLHQKEFADILQPIVDDPRGGWRFSEDGTASLVWLRCVK
jgi:energy-coupling factor transporter ATP-binding protein EcfA2